MKAKAQQDSEAHLNESKLGNTAYISATQHIECELCKRPQTLFDFPSQKLADLRVGDRALRAVSTTRKSTHYTRVHVGAAESTALASKTRKAR
jgi:hypothetical protein